MSDDPFYSPNREPPRQPTPGEHVCGASPKGTDVLTCELRDHAEAGVELQIFRNGDEWLF